MTSPLGWAGLLGKTRVFLQGTLAETLTKVDILSLGSSEKFSLKT